MSSRSLLNSSIAALLMASTAPGLRADVTVRYKSEVKTGAIAAPAARPGLAAAPAVPPESVFQIKGHRAYTSGGPLTVILDLDKQQITVLDTVHRRYTTLTLADMATKLAAAAPPVPASAARTMDSVAIHVSSKPTGRIDTIAGVQAAETEVTLTVDMDMSKLGAAVSTAEMPQHDLTMATVVAQLWRPLPDEFTRVPALAEIQSYREAGRAWTDTATRSLQTAFQGHPIYSEIEELCSDFSKHPALLKMHVSIYVPMLGEFAQALAQSQHRGGAAPAPPIDPNAPMFELTTTAVEISSTPIDDSVFSVPDGYRPQPISDLIKASVPALPAGIVAGGAGGLAGVAGGAGGLAGVSPRPANAGRGGGIVRPHLPAVAKLAPGERLAATDMSWLEGLAGKSTAALTGDPQFPTLLQRVTPDAQYNIGGGNTVPLSTIVYDVFQGPPDPVQEADNRYFWFSARRSSSGRGRAFFWIDTQTGQAVGGIILFSNVPDPVPNLTLFSTQVGAPVAEESQLPPAFLHSLTQWSADRQIPPVITRFFVDSDGARSVVMHNPAGCASGAGAAGDRDLCNAVDNAAAQTDMQAAYFLLHSRFPRGSSAAAEIASEQETWVNQRDQTCTAPPAGETSLQCRTRVTRKRAQTLMALYEQP